MNEIHENICNNKYYNLAPHQIDRDQVEQQLALLGYKKGSTVYLRAFFHSDDPRRAGDQGRKAEAKNLDQLIKIVHEWQVEGRGVYLVVNGGGHLDKDVTQCRAIFYEHDDLDKEISKELWRSLSLPEPTFQVDTGGKSIHSYWVFSEPVDAALWKALQTDLLEYADADRALKNPSRVMRLAGAYHISPNGAFPSVIVAASETKYSFEELRAIIPTPRKEILPSISPMTTDMDIPLSECLRVVDRDFIANGEREGRRNDTGAALARNLIGTAARLQILGEHFTGDPRQLFDNYCARCSPPLDAREADQIWKSAEKNNPTATLTDDALLNCIKSWKRKQQALTSKTVSKGEPMPFVGGEVVYSEDERLRLAILDLSQEKNKFAFIRKRATICSHYRISKAEVEELIRETEHKTSTSGLQRSSFDDLLNMEIQELNWLIPELLPAGEMVILGGSPKSGKTLMAIDAAFAIATGEDEFLGIRPQRGKVLLISNDENSRSTKSKLIKRGFRSGDGKNLEVIFNWTIAQLYELEQVLDDFRPDLVIIDSLKSITAHDAVVSENSAEFANNIYALKNLLNQYNCASILIHHTNKNKDATGVAKLRGSTAIVGAVWGTWQLDHIEKPDPNGGKGLIIDPSDPERRLSVFARDVEGQILKLEFDPENNSYARTDQELIKEQNTMTERIMSVLRLNPHGLSGSDIIDCLGMTRENGRGVYTTLNRMEAKLLISTIKSPSDRRVTLYALQIGQHVNVTDCKLVNTGGDSLSPPPRVQNVDYPSESYIQQCLQDSQQKNQISQQLTENSQQLFDTKATDDYLKTTSSMDDSELVNIVNTGGGERESQELLTNSTECEEKQADEKERKIDRIDQTIDESSTIPTSTDSPSAIIQQVNPPKNTHLIKPGCLVRWANAPHWWGGSPARVKSVKEDQAYLDLCKSAVQLSELTFVSAQ